MKQYLNGKLALFLVMCLYMHNAFAQTDSFMRSPDIIDCNSHPTYLSISTGLNNQVGLIGVSIEQRFNKYFSLEGGVGKSTWGLKANAGIKLYLIPDRKKWALKMGYTYSAGCRNLKREMYVVGMGYSTLQKVEVDFKPATNFYIAFHDYYKISRTLRCYAQFGWAFKIIEAAIAPRDPSITLNKLNNQYQYPIFFRSPRGLIVSGGFSYQISNNRSHKKSAHAE